MKINCPGFCKECDMDFCPKRGTLDQDFILELLCEVGGVELAEKYEMTRDNLSADKIIAAGEDFFATYINSVKEKKRAGKCVCEFFLREDVKKIIFASFGIANTFDPRDQIGRGIDFYSLQISSKIMDMVCGGCNQLFCYTCYLCKFCR